MTIALRPEIIIFAEQMELEMRKKDALGYTWKDKTENAMRVKLQEERLEADIELNAVARTNSNVKMELVHEAIMTMIVYNKV